MAKKRAKRDTGRVYQRGAIWWIYYYAPTGERVYESTRQRDKRVALSLLAQRRRELADGTWRHPRDRSDDDEIERLRARLAELGADEPKPPPVLTVRAAAEEWIERRRAARVANVHDEEQWIRTWLLERPIDEAGATLADRPLADVTRSDVRAIVAAMQAATSAATGRPYAPRTVLHVYATIRLLFDDALADGKLAATPCTLRARKGELPPKRDADPLWRAAAVYTREEAERIISDERVPEDRRVYYALQLLGGMRPSEAAGRRWRDLDSGAEPLAHLLVHTQATRGEDDRGTKTGDVREVPVHPTLAKILAQWRMTGFPFYFGGRPQPDDFIVPSRLGPRRARTKKMLAKLKSDLERLGMRSTGRGRHAMRATFLTLLEVDGANMAIAARATHRSPVASSAPAGAVGYFRTGWADLCTEIAKLRIDLRKASGAAVLPLRRAAGAEDGPEAPDGAAQGQGPQGPESAPRAVTISVTVGPDGKTKAPNPLGFEAFSPSGRLDSKRRTTQERGVFERTSGTSDAAVAAESPSSSTAPTQTVTLSQSAIAVRVRERLATEHDAGVREALRWVLVMLGGEPR